MSIVILPADKGNSTVVMERCEYEEKLKSTLSDNTYSELGKDPTAKVERQVAKALKESENKGELPREKRLFLTPHASTAPQLYGLPKVHKKGYSTYTYCVDNRFTNLRASKGAGEDSFS